MIFKGEAFTNTDINTSLLKIWEKQAVKGVPGYLLSLKVFKLSEKQ